jgi:hypothetical protein
MANVNDLESTLLKVRGPLLIEVITEEGSMDQRDSLYFQSAEASSCRRSRH